MGLQRSTKNGLKRVGFWKDTQNPVLAAIFDSNPDPTNLVVRNWLGEKKEAFAAYLDAGKRVEQYFGYSHCRFNCGVRGSAMGTADLSDGVWLWPEGLSHYIREHDVVLPPDFTGHVLLKLDTK